MWKSLFFQCSLLVLASQDGSRVTPGAAPRFLVLPIWLPAVPGTLLAPQNHLKWVEKLSKLDMKFNQKLCFRVGHPSKTAVAKLHFSLPSFFWKHWKMSSRLHESSILAVSEMDLVAFLGLHKFPKLQFYLHHSSIFDVFVCIKWRSVFFMILRKSMFFQCFLMVLGFRRDLGALQVNSKSLKNITKTKLLLQKLQSRSCNFRFLQFLETIEKWDPAYTKP